jgi:hypothetical protein
VQNHPDCHREQPLAASEAWREAIQQTLELLDCFVAGAPRNDRNTAFLHILTLPSDMQPVIETAKKKEWRCPKTKLSWKNLGKLIDS